MSTTIPDEDPPIGKHFKLDGRKTDRSRSSPKPRAEHVPLGKHFDISGTGVIVEVDQNESDQIGSASPIAVEAVRRNLRHRNLFLLALAAIVVLIASVAVMDLVSVVEQALAMGIVPGVIMALICCVAFGAVAVWAVGEIRAIVGLKAIDLTRSRLKDHFCRHDGEAFRDEVLRMIDSHIYVFDDELKKHLRDSIEKETDIHAVRASFDYNFLSAADKIAWIAAAKSVREVSFGSVLSPVPSLSAFIVIFRSLRMVREVSEAYGYRPGISGLWKLMRHVLTTASVMAAVDVYSKDLTETIDAVLQEIGISASSAIPAKMTGKFGEGAVAAYRAATLAIAVMHVCRPLEFAEDQKPKRFSLLVDAFTLPQDLASNG